ncbi:MAG: hypothetical protein IIZ67_04480 [Bacilli bacterium]|nr:hypothetical protein [Bacilli bacterium]
MKINIKKILLVLIVFIVVYSLLILFSVNYADVTWNYGMSHAIRVGEIPYKDFNILMPPLSQYLMCILLFLKDSYLVFLFEQAILVTLFFVFMYKLIGNKVIILLPIIAFPRFFFILPNYNFLAIFLVLILLYLEKNNKNDYLIGVILSLIILTKHSIGLFYLVFILIGTFDFSKIKKRILGVIPLLVVFLIYLLINHNLYEFLDLTVFGLFDFGSSNSGFSLYILIVSILLLIYLIYRFIKNPKDINNYYLLGTYSFIIQIMDQFHFNYFIFVYLFIILYTGTISKKYIKYIYLFCSLIFVFVVGINVYMNWILFKDKNILTDKYFYGYIVSDKLEEYINNIYTDYNSRDNNYMYSYDNMFFDIMSDHPITYFDVPDNGNFGYDGINKMKKRIDNMHDVYFYVNKREDTQFCMEIYDYIIEVSEKKYTIEDFNVYYKE